MPLGTDQSEGGLLAIGQGDLIVLVGADAGQLREVAGVIDRQPLVVFEPDPARRASLAEESAQAVALTLAADETELHDRLARHLVYTPGRRVALMAPPQYREQHPEVVEQAARVVEQVVAWAELNHRTARGRVGEWLSHLTANTRRMTDLPDVTLLSGRLPRVPAVIVGAGPSLDQSMDQLAFAGSRAVVLAAASALGPMARAGLKPHMVLSSEARDESRQFVGDGLDSVFLASASTGHPEHFSAWPGPKGMFHLYPWLAEFTGGQALPTGGHVTSAAFALAAVWDCDPIILIGQDLAYTHGRAYGTGRVGASEAEAVEEMRAPAINGGAVGTSLVMHTYRLWYEEAARVFRSRWPGKRFINATTAGAHIQGFESCSIQDALAEHPSFVNGPEPIIRALTGLPRSGPKGLAQSLRRAAEGIEELKGRLKDEGPEAVRQACDPKTAAGFAARHLAEPNADRAALERALDHMGSCIARMMAEVGGPPA